MVISARRGIGEAAIETQAPSSEKERHVCVEDLAAVAEDLVATGVAQHESLGIRPRPASVWEFIQFASGAMMAWGSDAIDVTQFLAGGARTAACSWATSRQRPELVGAVVCAVPLLDMKRYSHLLAGASWRAEYGDPDTEEWSYLKTQLRVPQHRYIKGALPETIDDDLHQGRPRPPVPRAVLRAPPPGARSRGRAPCTRTSRAATAARPTRNRALCGCALPGTSYFARSAGNAPAAVPLVYELSI